jgi:hypothetical protein
MNHFVIHLYVVEVRLFVEVLSNKIPATVCPLAKKKGA